MAGRVSGEMEWSNGVMQRQDSRTWIKTMIINELSSIYTADSDPNTPFTPSLHSSITPLLPILLFEHAPNRFLGKSALIVGGSNDRNSSPKKSRKSRSDELVAEACIAHKSLS